MPKVSVIVPVYNVEKYVLRCLSSLENQTLQDIEIIVVNDGSGSKCDEIFNKISNKVKIIKHDQNRGKGKARKTGLKY